MTDFDNLVLDNATWRFHRNHITLFLADQGTGQGRADGNLAEFEVSLILTHDVVSDAFIGLDVGDFDGGAEDHLAGVRNGRDVDDDLILNPAFNVTNPRLDHTLLLAGSVVFGAGATIGILLPFSRNNELEADKLGVDYMHKCGYDVKQSVRLWEKMGAASTSRPTEWMSTHPNPETRIAELRQYITAKGYATF